MDADELRQLIDRELKALPAPRAPETLLPRVLAATVRPSEAAPAPARWYARPWLTWPLGWQIASVAFLVALGAAASMLLLTPPDKVVAPPVLRSAAERLTPVLATLNQAATLARIYWRVLLGPLTFLSLVFALTLSLACAGIWLALDRDGAGASQQ
jgi:hypothetical protein